MAADNGLPPASTTCKVSEQDCPNTGMNTERDAPVSIKKGTDPPHTNLEFY